MKDSPAPFNLYIPEIEKEKRMRENVKDSLKSKKSKRMRETVKDLYCKPRFLYPPIFILFYSN
jgi:hypothetical protein